MMTPTPYTPEQLQSYQEFCANPLRDNTTLAQEFEQLLRTSGITHVGFLNSDVLFLCTELITIKHPRSRRLHEVGEFIIFIFRKRTGRIWEVNFRFHNITHQVFAKWRCEGVRYETEFSHPHIVVETFPNFPGVTFDTGRLCINQGKFYLLQHLRKGEMHRAAPIFIEILNTYSSHTSFHHLGNWPRIGA